MNLVPDSLLTQFELCLDNASIVSTDSSLAGCTVLLDIDYSGTGQSNVVEFEGMHVAPGQDFTESEVAEIEKILENGLESDLVDALKEHYRDSGVRFINPHE